MKQFFLHEPQRTSSLTGGDQCRHVESVMSDVLARYGLNAASDGQADAAAAPVWTATIFVEQLALCSTSV